MRVILLSDVKKVGKKGQVVEVADGYARNFLIARKLAVASSEGANKVLQKQNQQQAALDEANRQEALILKEKIENSELVFKVKASGGRVSGGVSSNKIADEMKKMGLVIDKRKIIDNDVISTLGVTNVRVELFKEVVATIKVKLVEE